ncbi:hypothetical protein BD779DRAFT_1685712, partial [Infundibulicybe gibba]
AEIPTGTKPATNCWTVDDKNEIVDIYGRRKPGPTREDHPLARTETTCPIPQGYPAAPRIITDPTPEEQPLRKIDPADESDEDYASDEKLEREDTPEEEETTTEKRARQGRNDKKEKKRANFDKENKRKQDVYIKTRPGKVPDAIGVVKIMGRYERDNRMRGTLDPEFYYSRITNKVYVGKQARVAATSENLNPPSVHTPTTMAYYKANRGFPMNPVELSEMIRAILGNQGTLEERVEIFRLIREFRRISYAFLPNQRDITMKKALENEPYETVRNRISNQTLPEAFRDKYAPFGAQSAFKIEAGTGRTKAGLTQPDVEHTLHADAWAQYIVHHGRPGGDNQMRGIAVNRAFHVHRRSTFGYALARTMAPREIKNGGPLVNKGVTSTKTNFMRLFAILVAKPQSYREHITEWEQDTGETFTPIPTNAGEITITRIPVNEGGGANLTVDDVARLLIKNKIPPSWVDHAYTYGLYFLDYHIKRVSLDVQMFIEADDERLRRLAEHGEPPAIRAWDGWYIPSEHDKLRIRHLLDDEREKKKIDSLIDDDWLFIGEEVLPIYLRHRDARQAAHAYEDELNRLAALRHAEAVVREGPPTPQKETGTSNIATGSNVEDTTMGDAEDNSSIVESSGRNRPEEIPSDIGGELNDAEI